MIYLVTGVAGFIGFHVASQLCAAGHRVVGIDNLNNYYEVSLKEARLAQLASFPHFHFERRDLADRGSLCPPSLRAGDPSGGAGGGALLHRQSVRLCRQ